MINYRDTPEWGQTVVDLTGGVGVDHVVEVGGPNTLPQSIAASRTGGHLALIGAVAGFDGGIPFAISQAKRLRLQGVTVGSVEDLKAMTEAIAAHRMKPVIDRIFPFDQAKQAFFHMESGAHFGKVAVAID